MQKKNDGVKVMGFYTTEEMQQIIRAKARELSVKEGKTISASEWIRRAVQKQLIEERKGGAHG